jgi:hypothetical protein
MIDSGPPGTSVDNWAYPPQPPAWPSLPPAPPKRPSRTFPIAAAIVITILVGAAGGIAVAFLTRHQTNAPGPGAAPTSGPTSPATSAALTQYNQAVAAMNAAPGFHYVSVSTGPNPETITGDAGVAGGRQLITFDASYGAEQFTLVLVGSTVYFEGNVPAIEDQLGVSAANAATLASHWVSVSNNDGPYSVLQPGITVADEAQEIPLVPVSTQSTTSGGTAAIRIIGTIPAANGAPVETAHLDVIAASKVPVAYASSFTQNGTAVTETVTFTRWGTAPTVSAPAGAVAWSTLTTATPPGGYGSGGSSSTTTPTPSGQPAI